MTTLVATHGRNLIADVTAFRTWAGAADQAEARARCYIAGVDEGSYTRPFALIATSAGPAARRVAGGGRDYSLDEGQFFLVLEADADGDTIEDAFLDFANDLGGIISGILDLAGTPGYLWLKSLILEDGPRQSDEDEQDDYLQALFRAEWGVL